MTNSAQGSDGQWATQKIKSLQPERPQVSSAQPSEASASHDDGDGHEDSSNEEEDKENADPVFEVASKSRKKASDSITVSNPRNFISPALASSQDRTKESDCQMISLKAKLEFLKNLPDHLALHWDGSMMEDLLGIKNKVEAVLVSGGQGKYEEGKLLDVIELKDTNRKNTSTGEAQAKAVYATILDWRILAAKFLPTIRYLKCLIIHFNSANAGWRQNLLGIQLLHLHSESIDCSKRMVSMQQNATISKDSLIHFYKRL